MGPGFTGSIRVLARYQDHQPAEGVSIHVCAYSFKDVALPKPDRDDIEGSRRAYEEYLRNLFLYTRTGITDSRGSCLFDNLDTTKTYWIVATTPTKVEKFGHYKCGADAEFTFSDEKCVLVVKGDIHPDIANDLLMAIVLMTADGEQVSTEGIAEAPHHARFSRLEEGDYIVYARAFADLTASRREITLRRGYNEVTVPLIPSNCVRIEDVIEGGQGAGAGLKVGDIITMYDGKKVTGNDVLSRLRAGVAEGAATTMVIVRNGVKLEITLKGGLIGITVANFRN